jgi:hypothetical protein
MVRLRRIVFILDEAFEMSIERLGNQDIYTKSIELFREALSKVEHLVHTIEER